MCADHRATAGTPDRYPMQIKVENCGNCVFCISVCPFEALTQDPETKKVVLDDEKCRLCGICYGACPSGLITVDFYSTDFLEQYLAEAMSRSGRSRLVIACRGNTIPTEEIRALVERNDAILVVLPCLGRVTVPLLLDVVEKGMERVTLIPCQDEFCRFKEGSKVLQTRVDNANLMLVDFGLPDDSIEVHKRHVVPTVDKERCIACGLCVSVCPVEAASVEKDGTGKRSSHIDPAKCHVCGLCVASCPQKAISMPAGTDAPPEAEGAVEARTDAGGDRA